MHRRSKHCRYRAQRAALGCTCSEASTSACNPSTSASSAKRPSSAVVASTSPESALLNGPALLARSARERVPRLMASSLLAAPSASPSARSRACTCVKVGVRLFQWTRLRFEVKDRLSQGWSSERARGRVGVITSECTILWSTSDASSMLSAICRPRPTLNSSGPSANHLNSLCKVLDPLATTPATPAPEPSAPVPPASHTEIFTSEMSVKASVASMLITVQSPPIPT